MKNYILPLLFCLTSCNGKITEPPNIVFILVDDMGWTDMGCYGSEFYETPNIDKLASESIIFTNAYAPASVCSPSRASILTGKYPARLNITNYIPARNPETAALLGPQPLHELPLEEITIAEVLGEHGYRTFFCGKWHIGGDGFLPEDQGFDSSVGAYHFGRAPGGFYTPYKNPKLPDGPEGEYLTDRLTDESISFIREEASSPFFLFQSYYTVHTPIHACTRHIDKFTRKAEDLPGNGKINIRTEGDVITRLNQNNTDYASMVHAFDENVGRLIQELSDQNILDNTIIILTSDNGGLSTGGESRISSLPTSVLPLRAGKGWLYEGGIRVPLIIKLANSGGMRESSTCDVPVIGTDFFSTILDLAGIENLSGPKDGVSIVPLLDGSGDLPRQDLFWHYPHYHATGWTPRAAIRHGNWKLIEFNETGKVELYNLDTDIEESTDLVSVYPDTADFLLNRLHEMQQETGAKLPIVNPDREVE